MDRRLWQIGKFVGVAFWLVDAARHRAGLQESGRQNLLALFTASVVAIGLF